MGKTPTITKDSVTKDAAVIAVSNSRCTAQNTKEHTRLIAETGRQSAHESSNATTTNVRSDYQDARFRPAQSTTSFLWHGEETHATRATFEPPVFTATRNSQQ